MSSSCSFLSRPLLSRKAVSSRAAFSDSGRVESPESFGGVMYMATPPPPESIGHFRARLESQRRPHRRVRPPVLPAGGAPHRLPPHRGGGGPGGSPPPTRKTS